MPAVELPQPF
jgi:hypothetical protein